MKSLLKYFFAISLLVLSGCSQNASTPFTTNSALNSSNAIFDGDVNDPNSIAFFKKNVGDRVLFAVDQSDLDQLGKNILLGQVECCLLYTSPSPRDKRQSRMPSSA